MIEIWPRKLRPSSPQRGAAPTQEDVQLPMELTFSTPRDVVLTSFGRFAVCMALLYVIGAVVFSGWVYVDSTRRETLKRQMAVEGRPVTGHVIRVTRTEGKNPGRIVDYTFDVNGETYHGRSTMSLRGTAGLDVGSEVPVTYLPSRPSTGWIAGYEPTGVPLLVIPVMLVALLVGAFAMLWRLRRERSLLTEGRPALARVTAIKRVMRRNHSTRRVWLQYHLLDGAIQEGHADRRWQTPAVGATVVILYDRDRPDRVAIYPLRFVRVRLPG